MTCEPWPIGGNCDTADVEAGTLASVQDAASTLLWALSGRRYGDCRTTEWYVPSGGVGCPMPFKGSDGAWRNGVAGDCCWITLEHVGVREVVSVTVDGVLLDPAAYVVAGARLLRRDGCWPTGPGCTEPSVMVVYRYGLDPGELGALAMGEVVCEMLTAMGGGNCKLPSNAVTITRQGVTVELDNTTGLVEKGLLGLPFADQFITTANPARLKTRSRVYSPDMTRLAR